MTLAVYAGSFDPITQGHVSVIRQAARLFAHVRVLVAVNPDKKTLFTTPERLEMIRDAVGIIPTVSWDETRGYVVEYARQMGATILVRGIRGATDATFETSLAQQNRTLAPDIATILLPAEPELSSVSSSGLKAMMERGEDVTPFCPPGVAERLRAKFGKRSTP